MKPFNEGAAALPSILILLSIPGVAILDLFFPLGISTWAFYFIPLALSILTWNPLTPLCIAFIASALTTLDFFISPEGASPVYALINRSFAVVTLITLSFIVSGAIRNKVKVRRQEWLQEGQAGLTAVLAGDKSVEELCDSFIGFLCGHFDADVGAFFVSDDGVRFERKGGFALPREVPLPTSFSLGEGLLGEAARDLRSFLIEDVPEGYMAVGSGLGIASPRSLLIAPAVVDGKTNAVVELGFLKPQSGAERELLDRVSEVIAIAVRSALYRTKLQDLLNETQHQAEELRTQSEELRVSNEELEAQSRALADSNARLEVQQVELEQTNTQLEEQAEILQRQKDDLTESRRVLERQARDLEEGSRYKSEFLANMSHELRTPLNSSLILAQLLAENRQGNLTAEQVRFAETIKSSGNDLLALINDVLDLSKIEAGRLDVTPVEINLTNLFDSLRRTFQPVARNKGLDFTIEAKDVEATIVTDARAVEQIVRNLLSNAFKFTEAGSVRLIVAPAPGDRISFAVQDTGVGVSKEQHEKIFEAFTQADASTSRRYGGTGLGLSISRELARLLGGEIFITSEIGKGSTFTLDLPRVYQGALEKKKEPGLAPEPVVKTEVEPKVDGIRARPVAKRDIQPVRPTTAEDRANSGGRRILIIEDDPVFAQILCDLAVELQFQSVVAHTADEGLAAAFEYEPSAVILDLGLPDHSGLSVLDRLKQDARTRHIPVHIVSGTDHSQAAYAMGAAGYLVKPVKREEIAEAFESLEKKLSQDVKRVLIVDDDEVQLDALKRLLDSRDVASVPARSAKECLEQLRNNTFDCLVLDLSLPDASGFHVLRTLASEEAYSFPPAIVYTGRDLSQEEEEELRRYAKSIIIKGAKSPERLLDEVSLFLHQVVSKMPAEKQELLKKAWQRDAALEGKKVLLVEDDVRNIFALTSILEPKGVRLRIARNGVEALEALRKEGKETDLVLMDIMMPEMDGLTATREIRKQREFKNLPIIALTAKAMKDDQEECLRAGANDYMAKPLDVEKLLSLVRVWMRR